MKEIGTDFKFDLGAKKVRIDTADLLESLKRYSEKVNGKYFSTIEYDEWNEKIAYSGTISSRFGSWNKALKLLGIDGGRERRYAPEELIQNLESIWKQLGYPPGKRKISKMGLRISESPYKKIWGGVKRACEFLARYHAGKISREELMQGDVTIYRRNTVPLKTRWMVLKRDNYSCRKCGQNPSTNHNVELEVDHIVPVSRGGANVPENLQTLCKSCNQGKKDK
ncbi:hypothetical protein AUJ14_02180 [Candidatus Micrarchaeota archaeon CG1_02_55_22]|nr:MAG: hypothetical protein AUJ14_02180 [Candidatus Micrarchaeota archaeon CG1_02_55_22]